MLFRSEVLVEDLARELRQQDPVIHQQLLLLKEIMAAPADLIAALSQPAAAEALVLREILQRKVMVEMVQHHLSQVHR